MLVLSRKENESISIAGGKITVTVLEIRRDSVRLGIEAPDEVTIHRKEIQDKIHQAWRANDGNRD